MYLLRSNHLENDKNYYDRKQINIDNIKEKNQRFSSFFLSNYCND